MSVEVSSDFSAAVPSSSSPLRQIDAGSLNVGYVDVSPVASRLGYRESRREFNKLIWQIASPKWDFDDARSSAPLHPSTIPITLTSSSTITAG